VILVSEIGDKTFFIAAIMAMTKPRLTVYSGAMLALGLMTILSALLGNVLTVLIPRVYTYYFSSLLFAIFGIKMLKEGYEMKKEQDNSEEYEEANSELKANEEKDIEMGIKTPADGNTGGGSVFTSTKR
jgi:Ca2+/H+ antiporter, TMEM165/GDT1 family